MNEPTEFKYPLDEYGEPYFAGSHVNAIQGMEDIKDDINKNTELIKNIESVVNSLIGDTGWKDYDVLPKAKKNEGVSDGFTCGIREIRIGKVIIKSIRVNLGKVTNNEQVAQLPSGFIKKTQTFISRSNSSDNGVQFSLRNDGSVWGYINKADRELSSDRWVYYEHTWID